MIDNSFTLRATQKEPEVFGVTLKLKMIEDLESPVSPRDRTLMIWNEAIDKPFISSPISKK
jgi:hypothetical protein